MQIKSFLKKASKAKTVAVDTETTGVERSDHAFCISMTIQENKSYKSMAIVHDEISKYHQEIYDVLVSDGRKVFHNARFDIYHLNKLDFDIPINEVDDTMILAHLLYPEDSKKLKSLFPKHVGDTRLMKYSEELEEEFEKQKDKKYDEIDINLLKSYAAADTEMTLKLYNFFLKQINSEPDTRKKQIRYLYNLELKTMIILYRIETTGLIINRKKAEDLKKEYLTKADKHGKKIFLLSKKYKMKVNPESEDDMAELLAATGFDMKLLPTTKTGKISMQKKDLKPLIAKDKTGLAEAISQYWHYSSHVSMYIDNFLKGEKIKGKPDILTMYPKFSQTVAQTGRFTSYNPNFQNLPRGKEIRSLITAPKDHYIVSFDYKQIEVRVAAHCSKDFKLSSVFLENKDPYNQTGVIIYQVPEEEIAADNYGKRFICKKVVLGILYLMGPSTMSKVINNDLATMEKATAEPITIGEAKEFIEKWFNHYKGVNRYKWNVINFAKKHGYVINIYGRIRHLDFRSAYKGVNTIIQGSTADIIRYKMCQVDKYLEENNMRAEARIILQVHDELVYYIRKKNMSHTIQKIKEVLSDQDIGACKFSIPLGVDIEYGTDYGNLKDWKEDK